MTVPAKPAFCVSVGRGQVVSGGAEFAVEVGMSNAIATSFPSLQLCMTMQEFAEMNDELAKMRAQLNKQPMQPWQSWS